MARHPLLSRSCASPPGYTLVELVLVMAILAILAAFAAPRFFSTEPFDERGYADALAGALRSAQKAAVAAGCPVRLEIDAAGYRARLPAAAGAGCQSPAVDWTTPLTLPDGDVLEGVARATVVPADMALTFDASGALLAPADALRVGPWQITVDATTGYVTVTRP